MESMPKAYFSLVAQAKNYICPALIFHVKQENEFKLHSCLRKLGLFLT